MENINNFNFSWFGVYSFVLAVITLIYFSIEKLEKEGWDKVFKFFNSNLWNFINWGKEQDVLDLMVKIREHIFYIFLISFLSLIIISSISWLSFLSDIVILILGFSFLATISFSSILDFKKQSIQLLKVMFSCALICVLIFLILTLFNENNIPIISETIISKNEFYIVALCVFFICCILFSICLYIIYWIAMGFIPTTIFIIVFLITKSSYFLEKIFTTKKVATIIIILNIIYLFFTIFYKDK